MKASESLQNDQSTATEAALRRAVDTTPAFIHLPSPRNWAMQGGSSGYQAALVRRQLTPGLISSLLGPVRSPPFICFSTSYPELESAARST